MIILRLATIAAVILASSSCGRFEATREFNYGVEYFKDDNFAAAVRSFERASEALADPAIRYNLALAHLALVRQSTNGGDSHAADPEQVAAALAAVATTRELSDLSELTLAKLGYIEGSIHALAGDDEAARDGFAKSLEAEPDFEPALQALLELDPDAATSLGRLVLATAEVEELQLEETLSQ